MNSILKKWSNDENALEVERRLMNQALAQLRAGDSKVTSKRSAARLIFGLDLTASREASLKHARVATATMFEAIKNIGEVALKLVYYRGIDECKESKWNEDPEVLCRSMLTLSCESGHSQIARLLRLALAQEEKLSGVVFVGDHCEESSGDLNELAEKLGQKSIPLFVFHECADHDRRSLKAKPVFKRLAESSGGVYVEFKPDSGVVLRELLANVAAFSAAGIHGFERIASPQTSEARQLRGRLRLMLDSGKG